MVYSFRELFFSRFFLRRRNFADQTLTINKKGQTNLELAYIIRGFPTRMMYLKHDI